MYGTAFYLKTPTPPGAVFKEREAAQTGEVKKREELSSPHEGRDDDDVYYYIRWRLKLEGEMMMMFITIIARD